MQMLFGAMNHPGKPAKDEVLSIAKDGFDYCDFTYEGKARLSQMSLENILKHMKDSDYQNFGFVGHTAYYLPIAMDFDEVVDGSIWVFRKAIDRMLSLGIEKVTIHHDPGITFMSREERIKRHIYVFNSLISYFRQADVQIMLENSPGLKNQAGEIAEILCAVPQVGLHLDIAHALVTGGMDEFKAFLKIGENGRLKHVHISDNNGEKDDHSPVGVPHKVRHDWPQIIQLLKQSGYGTANGNNTITLEIFSEDHWNRIHSRDIIRELWENA